MRHQAIHLDYQGIAFAIGNRMQRHGRIVFHFERLCLNFPVHFENCAGAQLSQSESALD